MLFRKCGCLVAYGKYIFRKYFSVLTCLRCKMISVFILPSNTIFWKTEREREREREREEEERAHCRRPTSFDFTGNLETTRHEPRSLFGFAVWLRLQIAPRLHPLTSLANLEAKIARLRLRRLRTLRLCRLRTPTTSSRWHRDGTDRTNHTEFAIEKWLGFDEFDWVWWIFLVGFWWIWPDLCLSIEKLYYIFVWKLRKCEKM